MRSTRTDTTSRVWVGLFVLAAMVIPACESMSPTEATASTRVYGLDLQQLGGDPFVGDEVGVMPFPFTYKDIHDARAETENPVSGVRIRWTVSPTSVLQLKGPDVTTTKAAPGGFAGLDTASGTGRFIAVGRGEATITATIENAGMSYDLDYGDRGRTASPAAKPHSRTIKIQVVGKPARLELVPATTLTRAGVPVPLVAKLYSAEGDEIAFAHTYPFFVRIHCLDGPVAGFPIFNSNGGLSGYRCDSDDESETIHAKGPGTARFEATLLRKPNVPATTLIPALRATTSVTFTKPAARVVFDQPNVTLRVAEEFALRYRLFDVDNNEVPGGDFTLKVVDDPGGSPSFASLDIQRSTNPNEFRILPRSVLGRSEHTVRVQAERREGAGEPTLLPLVSGTASIRIVPRITGFDQLPSAVTLIEGDQEVLPFTAIYSFGAPTLPPAGLEYATSNSAIATITGSPGVGSPGTTPSLTIRGVSAGPTGTATATVTVRTFSAEGPANRQIAVTVIRRPTLTSVTLVTSPVRNITTPIGISFSRRYELLDQDGIPIPPALVDFTVQNLQPATGPAVAELSTFSSGPNQVEVVCRSPGTATVTARPKNTTLSSSLVLTCGAPSVRITAEPTNRELTVGAQFTYAAQVLEVNGTTVVSGAAVTWASSDASVAAINATTGAVTALKVGTVTITASNPNSTSATTTLTVRAAPPTIVVTPKSATIQKGQTVNLTAVVLNATGAIAIDWQPKTAGVVTISTTTTNPGSASVRGDEVGRTWVYATYTAGSVTVRDSAEVTVVAPPTGAQVAAVYFDPRDAEITAPTSVTLRARLFDAQGNQVATPAGGSFAFSSSNPDVAAITPLGGGLALARGIRASTTPVTIRVTYTSPTGQTFTDQSSLTVYSSGSAGHYGAVEIIAKPDVRRLRVGEEIIVELLVRDVNGIQQLTGVTGLTFPLTPNAALQITRDTSLPGYQYRVRALAVTSATGVEVRADLTGAAASAIFVVTP